MADLPDTSDIGMMYRNVLQQRGVPLTNENMNRVAAQMRGLVTNTMGTTGDVMPGLSVQGGDPTVPPNVAGASAQNSGQAPSMRAPAPPPLPPMQAQAQPRMQVAPNQSLSAPPGPAPRQGLGGAPNAPVVAPSDTPQSLAEFTGTPMNTDPVGQWFAGGAQTPPPGAPPVPGQSTPSPASIASMVVRGANATPANRMTRELTDAPVVPPAPTNDVMLSGDPLIAGTGEQPPTATSNIGNILLGGGGAAALGAGAYGAANARGAPPTPSSQGETHAPGSAANQRPVNAPVQGPPAPPGKPEAPLRTTTGTQPFRQPGGGDPRLFPATGAASQRPVSAPQQGPPAPAGKPPEPITLGSPLPRDIAASVNNGTDPYGLRGVRPVGPQIQGPPMGPLQVGPRVAPPVGPNSGGYTQPLPPSAPTPEELKAANIAAWEERMRGGRKAGSSVAGAAPTTTSTEAPTKEPITATSDIGNIITEADPSSNVTSPRDAERAKELDQYDADIAARARREYKLTRGIRARPRLP